MLFLPDADTSPVLQAFQAGCICAAGTAIGTVPALFIRDMPKALSNGLLAFGGGVMLAATVFSLILPALDYATDAGWSKWGAAGMVSTGIMLGALALLLMDGLVVNPLDRRPARRFLSPHVILFIVAMTAHNIPEGMAVGVATGGAMEGARSLTLGIALQDLPEGLVVALVLINARMSRVKATLAGAATGLVEPVAAAVAAGLVGVSAMLLPWGLAFAAGAMLVASTHGVIVESHREGNAASATIGLCLGFCVMMAMDVALG